ncbi:MAG: heme o synthase [Verrucomicrobiae bacterium]|nr:heme o synthase [Verrucomicrobiae bacterium]
MGVIADLVKARLTALVLLTTLVGFYVGSRGTVNWALMWHTLFGTALVAAGAAALNQLLEREHDARMRRTASRPLPSGRLQPVTVMLFGGVCSVAGLVYLAWLVNPLTSVLGGVSLVSYLFVYTPLKRITWWNTAVGAIPGGLPPLMGWAAARGDLGGGGWTLFALLAVWQLPHFYAIAWVYRDEYARAGFKMLPGVDPNGLRTARQALSWTLTLLAVSVLPFVLGLAGGIYLTCALALGAAFVATAADFMAKIARGAETEAITAARRLFFASIVYLPLALGALVLDKTG